MVHAHPTLKHHKKPHVGKVIAFSSFVHGSGRSTVANALFERLSGSNKNVVRLSTGEIFREIAERMGFKDLNQFADYLASHPTTMVRVETEIDSRIYSKIRELVREGKTVIIDSNLHAHPHALKDVPSIHFYVYAHPEIIGKRLMEKHRKAEKEYKTPKEALEAQIARTRKDADRYHILKRQVKDPELKRLYEEGERIIRRLLREYIKHGMKGEVEELRKVLSILTKGMGILVDNSGRLEDTLKQVEAYLKRM